MTENKRFFKKEYPYDWWFVFDKEQKYFEDMKIPFETEYGELIPMTEKQVVELLNTFAEENEKLNQRLKISNDNVKILQCENEQLKKRLELYGEIYPTGKWITELTSEELKKELLE